MRKRMSKFLSILLTLVMVMGVMPMTASAIPVEEESYAVWVAGTQVTSANANDVLEDGNVSYDPETNTLTVKGDIKATGSDSAIRAETTKVFCVDIVGDVTISAEGGNGIYATSGDVTITGGNITVKSDSEEDDAYAIYGYGEIEINCVDLDVDGKYGIYSDRGSYIKLTAKDISVKGEIYALWCNEDVVIDCDTAEIVGELIGIRTDEGNISIGKGNIDILSNSEDFYAIEYPTGYGIYVADGLIVTASADVNGIFEAYDASKNATYHHVKISAVTVPETATTSVTVVKEWNAPEGTVLPERVEVYLLANGQEVTDSRMTLDESNDWTHTWEELPVAPEDGTPIVYTVNEVEVKGYETTIGEALETETGIEITITNTLNETEPKVEYMAVVTFEVGVDPEDQTGLSEDLSLNIKNVYEGLEIVGLDFTTDDDGTYKGVGTQDDPRKSFAIIADTEEEYFAMKDKILEVTLEAGAIEGMTYDDTTWYVQISDRPVIASLDDEVESSETETVWMEMEAYVGTELNENGVVVARPNRISFMNTYEKTVAFKLPVEKIVEQKGNVAPGTETFKFELVTNEDTPTGAVLVDDSIKTDGKGTFEDTLTLAVPESVLVDGYLSIRLKEVDGNASYWTYDDTVYVVEIYREYADVEGDLPRAIYPVEDGYNISFRDEEDPNRTLDKMTFTNIHERSESSNGGGGGGSRKYTVTVEDTDNGSVESNRTKASKGTTVTITVDPEEGYEVDDIVVETKAGKEVEVTDKGEGKFTFKMPAADVIVSVDFAKDANGAGDGIEEYILLTIDSVIAWVFDEYVTNDVAPVIRNERTMLPARFVAEALGGVVTWDEAEQKVTIVNGEDTIVIFIGEPFATVNGTPVELDSPAFIENDRTYLPIRFIAENMGATVTWNADARTVKIVPGE